MKDFRDLHVWERSHALTWALYTATADFPRTELYGLTSQIRRRAVSIGANIAEGCGKSEIMNFSGFSRLRPARQVNSIMSCCSLKIWATSPNSTTR